MAWSGFDRRGREIEQFVAPARRRPPGYLTGEAVVMTTAKMARATLWDRSSHAPELRASQSACEVCGRALSFEVDRREGQ
jgi:hypothetical protein